MIEIYPVNSVIHLLNNWGRIIFHIIFSYLIILWGAANIKIDFMGSGIWMKHVQMKKCLSWSTILKEIQNLQNLRAITIMAVTRHESIMMKYKERSCTDSFVSSFFYYWALWWPISANLGLNFNLGLFFGSLLFMHCCSIQTLISSSNL